MVFPTFGENMSSGFEELVNPMILFPFCDYSLRISGPITLSVGKDRGFLRRSQRRAPDFAAIISSERMRFDRERPPGVS
jgi:hypothetical protein